MQKKQRLVKAGSSEKESRGKVKGESMDGSKAKVLVNKEPVEESKARQYIKEEIMGLAGLDDSEPGSRQSTPPISKQQQRQKQEGLAAESDDDDSVPAITG